MMSDAHLWQPSAAGRADMVLVELFGHISLTPNIVKTVASLFYEM